VNEQLVRAIYAARARGDLGAVRDLLDDDIVWHEPGEEDYSGDHRGADAVIALLERLQRTTEGTFELEPTGFLVTADHVAAAIRWSARRGDTSVEGYEIAVYRIAGAKIAEAWFHPDGYDPDALSAVFSPRPGSS
jgi:uncharacterized protein